MSIRAIQAVWDRSTAAGSMRLLLLALADFADEDGYSWPAVQTLSQRVGRKERRIQQLITAAIGMGELRAERVGGQSSSKYWLTPGGEPVGGVQSTAPLGCNGVHRGGATGYTPGVQSSAPEPSVNRQGNRTSGAISTESALHDGHHGPSCLVCTPPLPSRKGRAA